MIPEYRIAFYVNDLKENIGIRRDELIADINDVLHKAGYQYVEDSFGNDFSACSKSKGFGNYIIIFNSDQKWSEKFRRFTIAHELGHISIPEHRTILDQKKLPPSKCEYQSNDEIEREADCFAINFLASKSLFINMIKGRNFSRETIFNLSDFFKISTYATAIRFVELTDLSCSLIVCNDSGFIDYEKRSKRLEVSLTHNYLYGEKVNSMTLTYDFINGCRDKFNNELSLNTWYHDLAVDVPAIEEVIELGYNCKFLALITSLIQNIDEFVENDS